jgi:hypothetical protein
LCRQSEYAVGDQDDERCFEEIQVRSGGEETGARALAFSRLDMSTFCDNYAANVGKSST